MTPAPNSQTQDNLKSQTDIPVGEILRRARLQLGQSLEDVEGMLRIRASQLNALENMDFDNLPGWVYVVGFVRSYAEYLGLDGDKVLQLLKTQSDQHYQKQELNIAVAPSESRMPDLWMIIVAGIILVVIVVVIYLFQSTDRSIVEEIPAPEAYENASSLENGEIGYSAEAQSEVEGIIEQAGAPVPRVKPENMDEDHRIIINVMEKSWVEISNKNGDKVVSRILNPGDSFFVPNDAVGMTMTTGNAGGIEVLVDNQPLAPLGKIGDIRRNIPLEPESLKEMFPQ